jgi:hypothetical protein
MDHQDRLPRALVRPIWPWARLHGVAPLIAGLIALAFVLGPTLLTSPDDTAGMGASGIAYAQSSGAYSPTPNAGCSPLGAPVGQANPPGNQLEPLDPIWCFNLNPPNPPCRVSGANDWVDTFDCVAAYGRFANGDYDYRVFNNEGTGATSGAHTQHFTNNQHWMDDNAGNFTGGTMVSPNRTFTMENGTIVVEHDFAAGISGYLDSSGGDIAWGEIDISDAPAPTGLTVDGLYAYGQFGGKDTFGCRIHAGQKFTCSYEAARGGASGLDTYPCFEFLPDRLVEISGFERCGTTHFGGDVRFGAPGQYFRTCNSAAQEPDMNCRDRFRLELNRNGLTAYVNGALYFQDTGWPTRNQLPAAWGTATDPLYVYFSDWEDRPTAPSYRFHWDRAAVNPHNVDGTFTAPSAAPNFCLGAAGNTCPMGTATSTPIPPSAAPTNTPTPSATPTPPPTSTSIPSATPTNTPSTTPTASPTSKHDKRIRPTLTPQIASASLSSSAQTAGF